VVEDANALPKTVDLPLTAEHDADMARAAKAYPLSIADWWAARA